MWKPDAGLWAKGRTVKPAGEEWTRLIDETWRTDVTDTTDAGGRATVPHAFCGTYDVSTGGRPSETVDHAGGPTDLTLSLR